jgi:hypothetical protein
MSVGRATVMVVGLTAIVATFLGVASMAFAGNGDPWILGQLNSATAITRLAGSGGVDGPMLQVTNNDAGSDDTALDLNVQSGEPPMTVNSGRKVTNLNADKLDGQSSGAFAAYERTVIVSPVGTNAQNGQALLDALASIKDASASKPYLLYIEPETYDLGNRALQMKPYVDIEGSGELNTTIVSSVTQDANGLDHGTVQGADNSEMRFLTARNTSSATGANFRIAVLNNDASVRLTHVTAEATGGGNGYINIGVSNEGDSNTTMTDVTATASGPGRNAGVQISDGSLTIRQSKLSATGSGSSVALLQVGEGSIKVALSQLVGGVDGNNTTQCFDNYDENLDAVNCRSAPGR